MPKREVRVGRNWDIGLGPRELYFSQSSPGGPDM